MEVLGWNRHDWGDFHTWTSYAFTALIGLHLAINWTWLTKCAAQNHPWRLAAGFLAGALIVGTFLLLPVNDRGTGGGGQRRRGQWGAALAQEPAPVPVAVAATNQVDYAKDIRPIFDKSCVSCHGARKASAGFRADRREDFLRDTPAGALVRPGNSADSPLIKIITGETKMRRSAASHILSRENIALVKAWIDNGAKP